MQREIILWTDRFYFVFYICFVVPPKVYFNGCAYLIGTSQLICKANELIVLYLQLSSSFLLRGIFEQILVFLFLFILGEQNM